MPDPVDELLVSVRADTRGFAADVAQMRASFDSGLVDGFAGAGQMLERSLLSALRKGSFGFDDLKRTALGVLDQIAARALRLGLDSVVGSQGGGGAGGLLGSLFGSLLGLPGRATGGIVAPDRPYLVGERGPEVFVPTSAGSVVANGATPAREVRVSIALNAERGASAPTASSAAAASWRVRSGELCADPPRKREGGRREAADGGDFPPAPSLPRVPSTTLRVVPFPVPGRIFGPQARKRERAPAAPKARG